MATKDTHTCNLGPPPPEEACDEQVATFGVSPPEKKIIRIIWDMVKGDLGGNGVAVFVNFFTDYPHNVNYFPFKVERLSDIATEPVVKAHAIRVMRELTACVDNLNKPQTLMHALKQNALNHRKRNITKQSYDELRLTILKTLGQALGAQTFTPEAERAWNKTLAIIFKVITDFNTNTNCVCGSV